MKDLSIRELTEASVRRRKGAFDKNRHTPWTASDWVMAIVGELGEAANILKKVRRGDFPMKDVHEDVGDELADVQIYLVLLADHLDIDLTEAVVRKFNAVSERVGSPERL